MVFLVGYKTELISLNVWHLMESWKLVKNLNKMSTNINTFCLFWWTVFIHKWISCSFDKTCIFKTSCLTSLIKQNNFSPKYLNFPTPKNIIIIYIFAYFCQRSLHLESTLIIIFAFTLFSTNLWDSQKYFSYLFILFQNFLIISTQFQFVSDKTLRNYEQKTLINLHWVTMLSDERTLLWKWIVNFE